MTNNDHARLLFLVQHPLINESNKESISCIKLIHPVYKVPCQYLVVDGQLLEIQTINQSLNQSEIIRSAFIDNTVQSDGTVYMVTLIDPIFMVIDCLTDARGRCSAEEQGRFAPLQSIISNQSNDRSNDQSNNQSNNQTINQLPNAIINSPSFISKIERVCDSKDGWDSKVYRLNDDRLYEYLSIKLDRLIKQFDQTNNPSSDQSNDQSNNQTISQSAKIDALSMLSEYLPSTSSVWTRLAATHNLTIESITEKPESNNQSNNQSSNHYLWSNTTVSGDVDTAHAMAKTGDKRKPVVKDKKTAKLQKIDTSGMKSLASFFGGKS